MLRIHKQALAEQDLIGIWRYSFENWGEEQADRYLDRLEEAFILIAENPAIGPACDYVRPGYRKFLIDRHLIMYRTTSTTLHIIRVLGAEMDYEAHF